MPELDPFEVDEYVRSRVHAVQPRSDAHQVLRRVQRTARFRTWRDRSFTVAAVVVVIALAAVAASGLGTAESEPDFASDSSVPATAPEPTTPTSVSPPTTPTTTPPTTATPTTVEPTTVPLAEGWPAPYEGDDPTYVAVLAAGAWYDDQPEPDLEPAQDAIDAARALGYEPLVKPMNCYRNSTFTKRTVTEALSDDRVDAHLAAHSAPMQFFEWWQVVVGFNTAEDAFIFAEAFEPTPITVPELHWECDSQPLDTPQHSLGRVADGALRFRSPAVEGMNAVDAAQRLLSDGFAIVRFEPDNQVDAEPRHDGTDGSVAAQSPEAGAIVPVQATPSAKLTVAGADTPPKNDLADLAGPYFVVVAAGLVGEDGPDLSAAWGDLYLLARSGYRLSVETITDCYETPDGTRLSAALGLTDPTRDSDGERWWHAAVPFADRAEAEQFAAEVDVNVVGVVEARAFCDY